jgi:dihydroflavonol-4-reductase
VLVVGGTGLIGWHTVCEMHRRGHVVTAVARHRPSDGIFPRGVVFKMLDVVEASDAEVVGVIEGHDAVVQAVGADPRVLPRGSAQEYFHRVNVEATTRLFRCVREAGVRRAVLLTSYFHALRPEMADIHPYVRSRVESERLSLEEAKNGLELMMFGVVPGRKTMGSWFKWYALSPLPLFVPQGGTNAMSACALAQAVAGALEKGVPGQSYLVGGENLSYVDLLSRFSRIAGRRKRVRVVSKKYFRAVMRMTAFMLKLARRESGLVPVYLTDVMTDEMTFDPTPSAEALGYRTDDLDEAIGEIVGRISSQD